MKRFPARGIRSTGLGIIRIGCRKGLMEIGAKSGVVWKLVRFARSCLKMVPPLLKIFTNNTCLLSSLVAVNHRTIAISSTLAPQTGIQLRPQSMTIQIVLYGKTTQMFCATTVKHARLDCWITSRVTGRGWLLSISYSLSSLSLFTLLAAARSETIEKITM